jgi:predicted nuclease of predicted toxin-antitoxin system
VKFAADEGVDQQIVDALRKAGHDVLYAAESEPSGPDDALLKRAAAEARILITPDKDFGELVYRQKKATHGVLLLRIAGLSQEAKVRSVVAATVRASEITGAFSVLSPGQLRVRKLGDASTG